MISQILLFFAGSAVLAVAWLVRQILLAREPTLPPFPIIGQSSSEDLSHAILEGFNKYPDQPFIVPTKPAQVVLPMSLYQEATRAPDEKLSFDKMVYNMFLGHHTGIGAGNNVHIIRAVRRDLTKNIQQILPLIQEEAEFAFKTEIGDADDWIPIHLYSKLVRMVAYLSGRIFVGLPLCRDEEWLKLSIDYTIHLGEVMKDGRKTSPVLHPLITPFLKSVRQCLQDVKTADSLIRSLVNETITKFDGKNSADLIKNIDDEMMVKLHEGEADGSEGSGALPAGARGSFISWLLQYIPAQKRSRSRIGRDQLLVSFAAIHTTTQTGMGVILDLATRPHDMKELREELADVIESGLEAVDENGRRYFPKAAFARMHKLDSFVKESQRMNPLGFTTSSRVLLSNHTFSNGLTLPKGTAITFPMWGVYNSTEPEVFNPELNARVGNKSPDHFDGFRYARLRQIPGYEQRFQAATTGHDALNFGHGTHACPGRFFALYEIKSLVVEFVRNFDIRLKGDVEGLGGEHLRPRNTVVGTAGFPDMMSFIELKKRDPNNLRAEQSVGK